MSLAPGARFGSFEIVAFLGAGGMGEVWRACDTRLDREVALKVLPPAAVDDQTARARLLREARLASKLNHPHVCTIHEVGEAEGRTFVAMELVEGQTLAAVLSRGALPADEVVRLGAQLADALAHAHEHGVVHRDFKSANVVLTAEGRAKVLDFGLAKRLAGEEVSEATTASYDTLTSPGVLAGTLAYMAPEQLRGKAADARSDVWALGVVLYEMASWRRPFQGHTGFALSSAILNEPPPALTGAVPEGLRGVIERCLEKEPARRYQRAAEVRAALEAIASGAAVVPGAWPRRRSARRLWLGAGLAGLVAVVAAAIALDVGGLKGRLSPRLGNSGRSVRLAVLPFANLSGDPEQEYLSDGLTQEMIAQLGRLHHESLSVIARTSVMRYKKTQTPVDQIGRELGVDHVLEGSAQREAGRIRITAELIKVADQTQLWAESYERELSGILALQSEVARKVAAALALKLLPAEQARLANVRTVNPEAYDLCLRGQHEFRSLTPGGFEAAERYFELALQKDPSSALAHAGIATVWAGRQQMAITTPSEAGPKAKAAVLRALSVDDSLATVHATLALVLAWTDWDWAGAEREYRRAIELDPGSASGYSHVLMILRRPDEAMPQIERVVALDPVSALTLSFYAFDLLCAHRYDDAIAKARQALRLQPGHGVALTALIRALHETGQHDEVIKVAAGFYADWLPDVGEALERGYREAGYTNAWRRAADVQASRHAEEPGVAVDAADNYLFGGDTARALDWLEKAIAQRDPNVPYVNCLPAWEPVRPNPRFQALLRRMNLGAK